MSRVAALLPIVRMRSVAAIAKLRRRHAVVVLKKFHESVIVVKIRRVGNFFYGHVRIHQQIFDVCVALPADIFFQTQAASRRKAFG